MKINELKELIKNSLKEVLKEELREMRYDLRREMKEILKEELGSSQSGNIQNFNKYEPTTKENNSFSPPLMDKEKSRAIYESMLVDTGKEMFGLGDYNEKFDPSNVKDPINGSLGTGDVDMNLISKLTGLGG